MRSSQPAPESGRSIDPAAWRSRATGEEVDRHHLRETFARGPVLGHLDTGVVHEQVDALVAIEHFGRDSSDVSHEREVANEHVYRRPALLPGFGRRLHRPWPRFETPDR